MHLEDQGMNRSRNRDGALNFSSPVKSRRALPSCLSTLQLLLMHRCSLRLHVEDEHSIIRAYLKNLLDHVRYVFTKFNREKKN